jgi:hypothetical protein
MIMVWRNLFLHKEEQGSSNYRSALADILEFYPARGPFDPFQPEPEVYIQICYPYPT